MKFSVCVMSVRAKTLKATIASIRGQSWQNWELIVVGQGLDPALKQVGETAAREDSRIRYLHIAQRGATVARNRALKMTTGDIIALTDDDCEARQDWLGTLARYFEAEPAIGVVGGALLPPPKARQTWFAVCPSINPAEVLYDPVISGDKPPADWGWMCGNVAFRRSAVEQIGEFDECLGPGAVFPAADDDDYRLRATQLGIKMRSTPEVVVLHTAGYRYGLRAMFKLRRDYALASGGLAAKLTLMGDLRGPQSVKDTWQECTWELVQKGRLHHLPRSLVRLWYFNRAYQRCLQQYRVDPARKILYPIKGVV